MRAFCFACERLTPYQRGEADGFEGRPGPAFPTALSPWSDRLYNRGWEAGITRRAIAAAVACSMPAGVARF
jgi:hypothetical protein